MKKEEKWLDCPVWVKPVMRYAVLSQISVINQEFKQWVLIIPQDVDFDPETYSVHFRSWTSEIKVYCDNNDREITRRTTTYTFIN